MSATSEAIIRIDAATQQTIKDLKEFKTELKDLRTEVDDLQLARARLDGQIDMLWKLVSLIGITGIVAIAKAFSP